jgi:hypothetical protein
VSARRFSAAASRATAASCVARDRDLDDLLRERRRHLDQRALDGADQGEIRDGLATARAERAGGQQRHHGAARDAPRGRTVHLQRTTAAMRRAQRAVGRMPSR